MAESGDLAGSLLEYRESICKNEYGKHATLDQAKKTALRNQSLEWLKGVIAGSEKQKTDVPGDHSSSYTKEFFLMLHYTYFFQCVRFPANLAKLPEPERKAWHDFWEKYDEAESRRSKER